MSDTALVHVNRNLCKPAIRQLRARIHHPRVRFSPGCNRAPGRWKVSSEDVLQNVQEPADPCQRDRHSSHIPLLNATMPPGQRARRFAVAARSGLMNMRSRPSHSGVEESPVNQPVPSDSQPNIGDSFCRAPLLGELEGFSAWNRAPRLNHLQPSRATTRKLRPIRRPRNRHQAHACHCFNLSPASSIRSVRGRNSSACFDRAHHTRHAFNQTRHRVSSISTSSGHEAKMPNGLGGGAPWLPVQPARCHDAILN